MTPRLFALLIPAMLATLTAAAAAAGPTTAPAGRPNILLIIADDLCWRDLGCTGNPDVRTPNLDRMRADGLLMRRMYSTAATCTPCRSALFTGLHGVRTGAYPNHSDVRDGTRSLFTYLTAAGYRVALQAKSDVRPAESFPFEHFQGMDDVSAARGFITRRADQPWLLVFGSDDPHSPWNRGPQGSYDPAKLHLPAYLHDNATTREKVAAYYAEVTSLDDQVGRVLKMVADAGQTNRTLVVFVSEQGSSFPYGGKWTLSENGIRSATIVRWPGVVRPGSTTDALASYADLTPTFVAAAGVDPATVDTNCPDANGRRGFDGRNLLDLLRGRTDAGDPVVFAQHTLLGVIGAVGPFPTRAACDGHYKLVRNLAPEKTLQFTAWRNAPVYKSWVADAAHDPALAERLRALSHPPAEQLFDVVADPLEEHNLADDPAAAAVKVALGKQLDAWMAQQGDHGLATELAYRQHMKGAGE